MIVEINKIEKYEDSIFGSCLIVESYPIIDSPFGFGGAVDLTRKFYFIYPDNKNFYDFLLKAKNNPNEYFEASESAFTQKRTDRGTCFVHNSLFNSEENSTKIGNAVDLGLSVQWADMNVGASSESDYGILYGYGDVTGELYSEDENDYATGNIVGTNHDVATKTWGDGWRMPTAEELKELSERCQWKEIVRNGVVGSLVTGPSGNNIFFPYAGVRMGLDTFRRDDMGQCWSGSLNGLGCPSALLFYGSTAFTSNGDTTHGCSVRPVKDHNND